MPPYYGPRVLPRKPVADPFATAIGAGFDAYDEQQQRDRQAEESARAEERHGWQGDSHEIGMESARTALATGAAGAYDRGIRDTPVEGGVQLTDDAWLDPTATPEARRAAEAQKAATAAQEAMASFYSSTPEWFREYVGGYAPGTDYRTLYDDVLRERGSDSRSTADRSSRETIAREGHRNARSIATMQETGRNTRHTETTRGGGGGGGGPTGTSGLTPQQALQFGLNVQQGSELGPDPALARQVADSAMQGGALPSRDEMGNLVWPAPPVSENVQSAFRGGFTQMQGSSPGMTAGGKPTMRPETKAAARQDPELRAALKARYGYTDDDFK